MTEKSTQHFGEHIMIDGYGGAFAKLNSRELVASCLSELPRKLMMSPLSEPQVYWAEGNGKKDPGGWSGFVVIAESHISIHTFPTRAFVSIDVYSCRNGLPVNDIIAYFVDKFSLLEVEKNFINRGTRFPEFDCLLGVTIGSI